MHFSHGCSASSIYSCPAIASYLLQSRINQRQISCQIKPLLHRYWIDCNHYFQRRRYVRLENVTALRGSIWPSHQHVGMDHGPSLVERDIATHTDHFVLTIDGNLLVHFALGIEPSHRCSIQRSDSGEMRTRDVIFLSKLVQPG